MAAILETTPEFADDFLPHQVGPLALVVRVGRRRVDRRRERASAGLLLLKALAVRPRREATCSTVVVTGAVAEASSAAISAGRSLRADGRCSALVRVDAVALPAGVASVGSARPRRHGLASPARTHWSNAARATRETDDARAERQNVGARAVDAARAAGVRRIVFV